MSGLAFLLSEQETLTPTPPMPTPANPTSTSSPCGSRPTPTFLSLSKLNPSALSSSTLFRFAIRQQLDVSGTLFPRQRCLTRGKIGSPCAKLSYDTLVSAAASAYRPQSIACGHEHLLACPALTHPIQSLRLDAQSARKGEAEFDVPSIRVNKSHHAGSRFAFTADGFYATNISITLLLKMADGVEEDQIVGLPRWATSERFDIAAKAVGKDLRQLPIEQRKQMIRPLLADRFQLRFHEVEKNVYVHTLAISKNGSKLRRPTPDSCSSSTEHG